jgi:cell division protein FtsB
MLFSMLQKYSLITRILFLLILAAQIMPNIAMGSTMQTLLPENVAEMTKWKSRAEAWALKTKQNYSTDSTQYKQALAYYIDARAAVDALIAFLKTDLILSGDIEKSESYNRLLDEAARKSYTFIQYSEKLYIVPRSKYTTFSTILKDFVEVATTIIKEVRNGREAKKEKIRAALDDLRWKSFDDI